MPVIRIGGVPEHFNYPIHMAIERCYFEKHGVEVVWHEIKEGTGAMIKALKEDAVDVIVALTEGLVSDIALGSDLKLIGCYVSSPLCWAVSTGANKPYNEIGDLQDSTIAISRFTSGSHLMANVMASQRGWDLSKLKFKVVGSFQNLRNAVNDPNDPSAAFMWETFTTKPFHDSGEIKRIGDVTTPWPCFMLSTSEGYAQNNLEPLRNMLKALREACTTFASQRDLMPLQIARRYGLQKADAEAWYSGVRITANRAIQESAIRLALSALRETKVIPEKKGDDDLNKFIFPGLAEIQTDIRQMPLYDKHIFVRFLYNELAQRGLSSGNVSYQTLSAFDIKCYNGRQSIEKCAQLLKLKRGDRVINFGSGLGGCARFLAGTTGCEVLAVELQTDLNGVARELTSRCESSVSSRVRHAAGDFRVVGQHLATGTYDAIVSWLTVLHIDDRPRLFQLSYDLLKPGGALYIDDFVKLSEFSDEESEFIALKAHCRYCPLLKEYLQHLTDVGFELELHQDLTDVWRQHTKQRAIDFKNEQDNLEKVHGAESFEQLYEFYSGMADVFGKGNLGGLRLIVRKPCDAPPKKKARVVNPSASP